MSISTSTTEMRRLSPSPSHVDASREPDAHGGEMDTLAQNVQHVAAGMIGRRLMYRDLIADNGRSALAS